MIAYLSNLLSGDDCLLTSMRDDGSMADVRSLQVPHRWPKLNTPTHPRRLETQDHARMLTSPTKNEARGGRFSHVFFVFIIPCHHPKPWDDLAGHWDDHPKIGYHLRLIYEPAGSVRFQHLGCLVLQLGPCTFRNLNRSGVNTLVK